MQASLVQRDAGGSERPLILVGDGNAVTVKLPGKVISTVAKVVNPRGGWKRMNESIRLFLPTVGTAVKPRGGWKLNS